MKRIDVLAFKIYNYFIKKVGITISILLLLIVTIFIGTSLVYLISRRDWFFDLSDYHELGDAFGGLSSPLIGFLGVILTFFAFYVQYSFNKKQLNIYEENKFDKKLEEYNSYLEKICLNDNEYDPGILNIVNSASINFLQINIETENEHYNFKKLSIEQLFLNECSKINNYIKDNLLSESLRQYKHYEKTDLNDKVIKKMNTYKRFCQLMDIFHGEFEAQGKDVMLIQNIIRINLKKLEWLYPMYLHDVSMIFITEYAYRIDNKIIIEAVTEQFKTDKNYSKVEELVKHSLNLYKI